jgi:tRNA dimethylallyltransferase
MPHHLIDMVDPAEPFSASQFEHHARLSISDIRERGRVPLVIGGTGLYIRALLHGLFEGPQGDPAFRERLAGRAKEHGVLLLHQDLQKIDLEAAERIHPNDLFRVIRALEVFHLTGVPISQHQQRHRFAQRRYHALCLGLAADRSLLYRRINARVNKMIAQGLIQEVEDLLARGYSLELPALQAIGYRHIGGYLQGLFSLGEALRAMKRDTRHYARRQMAWFRGMPEIRWFMPEEAPRLLEEVQRFFRGTL